MQVLNPSFDIDWFFKRLKGAARAALLLDYDGTLAPFRRERDRAVPYPGVGERLERLMRQPSDRLVIVSGRWSRDLKPLLGLTRPPEIWGCHGAERALPDGTEILRPIGERAVTGLVAIDEWARKQGLARFLERKPTSVAFHWRGRTAEESARLRELITGRWDSQLGGFALQRHEFDGGLEIRVQGVTKAEAVREILAELPAGTPLAYLGDDLTDEDAFAALPENALKILVRPEKRRTLADLWLIPPEELLAFFDRWIRHRA